MADKTMDGGNAKQAAAATEIFLGSIHRAADDATKRVRSNLACFAGDVSDMLRFNETGCMATRFDAPVMAAHAAFRAMGGKVGRGARAADMAGRIAAAYQRAAVEDPAEAGLNPTEFEPMD